MKKKGGIIAIIGMLALSTGGLAAIHFQDNATIKKTESQLSNVNASIAVLASDMASMRASASGTSQVTSMSDVVVAVSPAVVRIDVTGSGFVSVGSGFIVDQNGYVLTNQHVIADATSIQVTLSTGDTYAATVVASDATRDLALIKFTSTRTDFPTISLGSASDAQVGDELILAGFPLGYTLTGPATFTDGIVSALRTIGGLDFIQTNAAINPGNSGGPIFNNAGLLVGMVVSTVTSSTDNSIQGLGLGIPVADVLKFIDSGQVSCNDCHYTANS